jgi:hypothetical protein
VIQSLLEWVQTTSLAVAVGESWFPWVESAHVAFLAVVVGSILIVDARLMGFGARHLPFSLLSQRLLPWTWGAFAGAFTTGFLMFIANAVTYSGNTPFLIKMALLAGAGLNMLFFHLVTYRSVTQWDSGKPVPAARAAGILSSLLWIGVVGFGRWIGFV